MELRIKDGNSTFTDDFIVYLIREIRYYLPLKINKRKLIKWDDYLNSIGITTTDKYKISSYNVLLAGAHSLTYKKIDDEYIINIDNNAYMPYITESIDTLCKLINYGNVELKGVYVLTETFEYFSKNVNKYFDKYVARVMLCQ